jgi:hypothetical protein
MDAPHVGLWYGLTLEKQAIFVRGPKKMSTGWANRRMKLLGNRHGNVTIQQLRLNPNDRHHVTSHYSSMPTELQTRTGLFGFSMTISGDEEAVAFDIFKKYGLTQYRIGYVCAELLAELKTSYDLKAMKILGNKTAVTRVMKAASSKFAMQLNQFAPIVFTDTCCAYVNQALILREWVEQSVPEIAGETVDFGKGGPPVN